MFEDKDLQNFLETSSTIRNKSIITAEWNMNIYSNILALGNYRYRPNDAASIYRTIPNTFVLENKNKLETVIAEAVKNGRNVVVAGSAGGGKTMLVNQIISELQKLQIKLNILVIINTNIFNHHTR